MSKFNTKSPGTKTTNLAGGVAFSQSPKLEMASILLTSFAQDQFYRSANDTFDRLVSLIHSAGATFAARAAIYARKTFGMRSITHVLASELSQPLSGMHIASNFYEKIVHRPDDILEILAYHKAKGYKLTNAMRKGFSRAIEKMDGYQLAKYKGNGKSIKMVDALNILHPKATEHTTALMTGTLPAAETWETKLSEAGQSAEGEDDKKELKASVWADLIINRKIGYFALLRNLRNIIEQAPNIVPEACEILTNDILIQKSLVLPFRYTTAIDELKKINQNHHLVQTVLVSVNVALDKSVKNVPFLPGHTLVALDISGSMMGRPSEIASLFAAILVKSNQCDVIMFSDHAQYKMFMKSDSTSTIAQSFRFSAGGTNFSSIFQTASAALKYDRIIILSDMQGWELTGRDAPHKAFEEYKKMTGTNPLVYSMDLAGHGSMKFPQQNVFAMAGFSEKVFDIMALLEKDKDALIQEIESVKL